MKRLIKSTEAKRLLATAALVLFTYAMAASQSLSLMGGNGCVGQPHSFWLSGGSGCSVRWDVLAAGDYQIIEQSNERIIVSWTTPDQAAAVIANYSCSGGQSGSSGVSVPIHAYATPTVSITADRNNVIAGTAIKFTASATNQGSSPQYVWYVNNSVVSSGASNSYTTTTLNNGDRVKVVLNSNSPCLNSDLIPSNEIQATINHYPVVNAGSDQTLMGTRSVMLTGTASDPAGSIASVSWTKVSGPAATLSGQNTLTLLASDLVKGVYVFRLTATDNSGLSSSDNVTISITVPPNNYNWIKETTVLAEGKKNESEVASLSANERAINWNYFDGLGRPMQSVQVEASPGGKDIVQPIAYDEFGRERFKYLPYVSTETSGYYKANSVGTNEATYPASPQAQFYSNPAPAIAYSAKPFAETTYELSPLNRVIKQGAPGEAWQPDDVKSYSSTDRTIKQSYETNAADEVLLWAYTAPTESYPLGLVNAGITAAPVYYAPNQLFKNKTKDEEYHEVIEYVDKEGRTVLKRVQVAEGIPAINDTNYASTYYIYDDFGSLVCVIPPEAVSLLSTRYHNVTDDATKEAFLKRWAFRYRYDARRRMSYKQVPGAEPVYMVYDDRDRLVLTQDGNQRKDADNNDKTDWLFTKYDHLNRPVLTGIYTADIVLDQTAMQGRVNDYYNQPMPSDRSWFERYIGSQGAMHGYENKSFPDLTDPDQCLTVTYYDDYAFRSLYNSSEFDFHANELPTDGSYPAQQTETFPRVSGLVTGTMTRMLTTTSWVKSVNYYDDKYRLIQQITGHPRVQEASTTIYEIMTSVYDFAGKVLRSKTSLYADQAVVWINLVNTQVVGETVKGTHTASWVGGASSSQSLPANTDGWVEFTVDKTAPSVAVGLNTNITGQNYTNIDYCILVVSGEFRVYEEGAYIGAFGNASVGDLLRVERVNGKIHYKRNGLIVHTSLSTSAGKLTVDASLQNLHSQFSKARVSNTFSSFKAIPQYFTKRFVYDHAGRLLESWHRTNGEAEILLAKNDYNELGQLVDKKLHSTEGNTFKQSVDYRYNIRGWLTRINKADLTPDDANEARDYFGMEFGYNNDLGIGTFTPQYNGNISATKWSANLGLALPYLNEPTQRAYKFTYDPMNRLREANYAMKVGSWSSSLAYREAMDYDLNGNILSLYRNNAKGVTMDWLEYNYGTGSNKSNQLKSVTDYGILTKGFRDGNTSGDDYAYDGNGNLVLDKNKEISVIKYNSLNVTEQIDKSTGEKIKYIYDADGIKLAEEIYPAGAQTPVKRIDYVGPLVYENDTLKFIVHEEGKIVIPKDQSGPEYQYQIKDHLGNIRLTFTTKEKTEVFKATMEDTGIADYNNPRVQEMQYFGNLFETEIRNVNQWLNHTSNSIGNAIYLDGSENKTIGPYTMLKVYPGDTVKMEVFAKFENKSSHSTMPLVDLLVALATPVQTAAIGFEGGGAWSSSSFFEGLLPFLGNRSSSSTVPAAYINYILFDKDFKVVDLGFDRIDGSAGFNPAQESTVSFDKLELQRIIDRVGYIYVYVSNESEATRVWMDDIKITYGQSPIVQFEDYYPFGLSQAETAFQHGNDKYTGMITTDGTGLKDLGFRQYDAALGRFHAVDPLAELQIDQSTYQYAGNNPVNQIDVLGLEAQDHDEEKKRNKTKPPKRDKQKQRVKEKDGYSRYKPDRRNDRQRANSTQTARRRDRSNSSGTSDRKKKDKSGDNVSASKSSGATNESGSSDPDPAQQALINMLFSEPQLNDGREKSETRNDPSNVFNNQNNNNWLPRFENSVTPPRIENDIETVTPSVVQSAALGETVTDIEQYRQYLDRNHSNNEARALYARMLVSRNYNYQSNRLKESIAAVSNTSTSEDKILDQDLQDPPSTSTPAEALAVIPASGTLPQSTHFPNVNPDDFLNQLRERVSEGGHEKANQGYETNFCWAAAITKYAYENDPKGMAEAMIGLYENGTFVYDNNNGGMSVPEAAQAARNAVGSEVFDNNQNQEEGRTINELDQMLFMTLADHYKEYMNLVDMNYDPHDEENHWWSGAPLSKAVKVLKDFGYEVEAQGSDLFGSLFITVGKVQEAMESHDVILFVHSDAFKKNEQVTNWTGTHYIHVSSIEQVGSNYKITYWDYGKMQVIHMSSTRFYSAVYGMIQISRKND